MNLVERVQAILLKPKATWPIIEGEPDDIAGLYKNYLVYLAGVSSLAAFIGFSLIGTGMMGIHFRVPILAGLANMVVGFGRMAGRTVGFVANQPEGPYDPAFDYAVEVKVPVPPPPLPAKRKVRR